jgi:hypothetical protein
VRPAGHVSNCKAVCAGRRARSLPRASAGESARPILGCALAGLPLSQTSGAWRKLLGRVASSGCAARRALAGLPLSQTSGAWRKLLGRVASGGCAARRAVRLCLTGPTLYPSAAAPPRRMTRAEHHSEVTDDAK